MKLTPSKLNTFLFFKLPAAFWCGVRVKSITDQQCVVNVKHRWINQNPFGSMYFAVLAMAAELSTGALVLNKTENCGRKISVLVANSNSNFSKKAVGRITFECNDGNKIEQYVSRTIETGEGQTFWMNAVGSDEKGDHVAEMNFEWTIKLKS